MKIGIIVPSRARPEGLEKHINSYIKNASNTENIYFYSYLDEDEIFIDKYKIIKDKIRNLSITIGATNNFSKGVNLVAMKAYEENCDLVIFGNDDIICKTKNWDIFLVNNFNSLPKHKIGCFLLKSNSKCKWAFPAVTRSWIKNVGHFSPGIFNFFFHDTWIFDISQKANCVYEIDSISLYHDHYELKFGGLLRADETHFRNYHLILRILRKIFGKKRFPSKFDLDEIIFKKNEKERKKISEKLVNAIKS